jgi:hypothetical protein
MDSDMPQERPRRAPRARVAAPSKKSRLPMLVLTVVVLAGLGFGAYTLLGTDREAEKAALDAEYAAAPVVEAEAFATEWRKDNAGFDKKYRNTMVAISGEVGHTETLEGTFGKQLVVLLKGLEGANIDARVGPDHAAALAGVKPGDKVTLVGRYMGDNGKGALVLRGPRRR